MAAVCCSSSTEERMDYCAPDTMGGRPASDGPRKRAGDGAAESSPQKKMRDGTTNDGTSAGETAGDACPEEWPAVSSEGGSAQLWDGLSADSSREIWGRIEQSVRDDYADAMRCLKGAADVLNDILDEVARRCAQDDGSLELDISAASPTLTSDMEEMRCTVGRRITKAKKLLKEVSSSLVRLRNEAAPAGRNEAMEVRGRIIIMKESELKIIHQLSVEMPEAMSQSSLGVMRERLTPALSEVKRVFRWMDRDYTQLAGLIEPLTASRGGEQPE